MSSVSRSQVLGFRLRAQQLDGRTHSLADTKVLDFGVQDTGPDGALWALALRGVDVAALAGDELAKVWTIRGAPHVYRREDLPAVAAAVEPFSDADAGKRIFDASKPLKAAGIGNLTALDTIADVMRSVVTAPMVKGDVSGRLNDLVEPPYLRFCRPCNATHVYEQPFRFAALRAGLELEPGTSPPVLRPVRGFEGGGFEKAEKVPERLDVIRGYLRLLGPATPKHVAAYLDAPVKDVTARWPEDAVEVVVDGEARSLLAADSERLDDGPVPGVQLLAPFDLFLQTRDRTILVDDPARAKQLWPTLGRPGAVLLEGQVAGVWRPRKSGKAMRLAIELWTDPSARARKAMTEQAERLATFRGVQLGGVDVS